jgi:hypothetical protein
MPNIYDPKYRHRLALLQGEMDANIELARRRTDLQADELGPVELEQNIDDANKIAREKEQGLGLELRPLRGLPPINRGGNKRLSLGASATVVQNYHSPPEDAEMIAITFGIVDDPSSITRNQIIRVELKVEWGVGGANFDAMLDGYDGLVFCLPACKLKVDARYRAIAIPGQPPPADIFVNASLAYGTIIQRSTPTRFTSDLGVIAPGVAIQDIIPAYANCFTVLSSPVLAGPPPFPQIAQPATSIVVSETELVSAVERKAYFQLTDNTNVALHTEDQFPLFNGAAVVTVTNNGAVPAYYTIVYGLAL